MNALQIREILMKVGTEVKCPMCTSAISPSNISIDGADDEACMLKMQCSNCNTQFGGRAQMMEIITPLGKKMNASSRLKKIQEKNAALSHSEIENMKQSLQSVQSLTDMFPNEDA